jgi:hypothetical protein
MSVAQTMAAFLIGQSDPSSNALTPVQRGFFAACGLAEGEVLKWNFPYDPSREVHRQISLWRASWNNSRQYLASRKPAFPESCRQPVLDRFASVPRVVLVAGSCGLELLVNLQLPAEFLAKTWVFALGPVSRSIPDCARIVMIQGRSDYISKAWHRHADHQVGCGHMGYLTCPEVVRLFTQFYQEAKQA